MVTLKEWFEKKDYGLGLAILGQHCKNRVLLQNLSRKPNPGKLEYELTKLVNKDVIAVIAKVQPLSHSDQVIEIMNNDVRNDNPDSLPKHLKAKWHENHDAYKEIRALHEKLKLMVNATPEDRQPLTERVASLDDKIRANWEAIDGWVPGAELPAEPVEKPVMVDHKRINANRKFISSNLRKLETGNFKKHAADLLSELQKRVTELIEAGEQMNTKTIEQLQKFGINN